MKLIVPFVVGLIFALGLGVSKMSQPQTINAFLDLGGDWSHQLLVVMVSALVTFGVLFRLTVSRRERPVFATRFMIPTNRQLTTSLIIGSAVFGLGWGLTGLCPGPALSTLHTGSTRPLVFLITMTLGMWLYGQYDAYRERRAALAQQ